MKYTGTIIGLKSSVGSIYHVLLDDKRCYIWKGNVVAEIKENTIMMSFNWNGNLYELKLSLLKENYYTGKIYYNNYHAGEAYLWSFKNTEGLILKGDFSEEDTGNYDCFVELRPYKN